MKKCHLSAYAFPSKLQAILSQYFWWLLISKIRFLFFLLAFSSWFSYTESNQFFGIYLFLLLMLMPFKSRYKRLIHLINVARVQFLRKLDLVDNIPATIRIPLWIFLLIFGFIALYIPLINGMILMIIWARMIGKKSFLKVYSWLLNTFSKKYKNLKSALFHTLKD